MATRGKLNKEMNRNIESSFNDVLTRFINSKPSSERNELCLALADIGNHEGYNAIISVIENEISGNNIGTLVYSLSLFKFPKKIELLVAIITKSNFEAAHIATEILEEEMNKTTYKGNYRKEIEELKLDYKENWRKDLVSYILTLARK